MSVIDEIKQKTDIVEVISQYATLKKSGRNLSALCPFHSEKNPSFYVYPERQSWHCFGACNTGGDVLSFIMKKENIDFGEALRILAQRAGVEIPSRSAPDTGKEEREKLFRINEAAAVYYSNLLVNSPGAENARNYLKERGLTPETLSEFRLGYGLDSWEALKEYMLENGLTEDELVEAGLLVKSEDGRTHDRFRNRLIFSISDSRGRITGFGARVLDDSLPKYVNSPQSPVFDKSGTLYGINLASQAIRQEDQAVMVEGYMDVITAHQNGIKNVVASMGTAVTERQVSDLKKMTRNIILALDADTAGEEAMLRCVDYENSLDIELKVVVLPEGLDPDNVIKEDTAKWQKFLDEALPVVDYIFSVVTATLDLTKSSDKQLAVERLGPVILAKQNPVIRAHYMQKLANHIGVDERTIEATLGRMRTAPKLRERKTESLTRAVQPLLSRPVEEQFLALLLQHPELKKVEADISPEYFENSENREIFIAWQQAEDVESLKESLDSALLEHLENILGKNVLATEINERYNRYVLRLKEDHLRGLARKGEVERNATELPGEQDIQVSDSLRAVFNEKARRGAGKGDKNDLGKL